MTRDRIDARDHLQGLVGETVETLTQRKPNRILRLDGPTVLVATGKSPSGEAVHIEMVQKGLDRLTSGQEVEVSVESLGHRSAFVGAALAKVPGAVVKPTRPRRIELP